jgi:hypothetical protein
VLEWKGEGVVDGLGFDQVVVIEDKDNPAGDGSHLVEQRGRMASPQTALFKRERHP